MRLNNISTMRTFEESPARWFMVDGDRVHRKGLEEFPYERLRKLIKRGKVKAIQKVK